ncbi:solute carrier family 41 member 1-like isoform X1 [Stegodyphus dumicola]|uniref:solute carrier family 41 member 1-like isoform X1 n=1 Tax=Stegodyphus dumicola TaxID=202533 RepID=UPI0015AD7B0F|nr:solute carrier family 41 member 1-like isoform X1 [Stegodyphus dumicola]XP_035232713.1 solute carrier family 41 member 1-like isoform X1 [Stegodyphus dumicola]
MAILLDIRRTEPMVELNQSESSVNLTSYAHEPVSFGNPTFQDDCEQGGNYSPTSPTVTLLLQNLDNFSTPTNNNDNSLSDQNSSKSGLKPSDSGILICVASNNCPNDDSSSLGDKSLDSGVYEATIGKSALDSIVKAHPGGEGDTWPTLPKDKDPEQGKKGHSTSPGNEESLLAICVQVFIPFLIAGAGTCGAGIVLDYVEKWEVFQKITELFILVPTLLGLKGNLEMTLASRVSTQANLGKLNSFKEQWQMCWGNMALIQCQATVMGLLAATFATIMSIANGGFNIHHALLLSASSLFTASLASLVLGAITLAVVVVSHKCNINPDNVATPIAASLGDVTTLALLAAISGYLYQLPDKIIAPVGVVSLFLVFVPVWAYLSYKNPFVKQVLYSGWVPVILAVVITSVGGYILEFSVTQFKGFAIFQPVINGVAGNLVAVQASRISTYFHRNSEKPGSRPPDGSSLCVSPFTAFFGKSAHARTARILMLMVIPGHLLFGYGITLIKGGNTVLTATFLPIYLISAFIQIALLLYIAQCLIQILWRFKIDPDNSAIPLLTALGDLSGMACLTIAFLIHHSLFLS